MVRDECRLVVTAIRQAPGMQRYADQPGSHVRTSTNSFCQGWTKLSVEQMGERPRQVRSVGILEGANGRSERRAILKAGPQRSVFEARGTWIDRQQIARPRTDGMCARSTEDRCRPDGLVTGRTLRGTDQVETHRGKAADDGRDRNHDIESTLELPSCAYWPPSAGRRYPLTGVRGMSLVTPSTQLFWAPGDDAPAWPIVCLPIAVSEKRLCAWETRP